MNWALDLMPHAQALAFAQATPFDRNGQAQGSGHAYEELRRAMGNWKGER